MTDIQHKLDGVISKVNRDLAKQEFVAPSKTEKGILVGDILIVPNGTQKDLYRKELLLYQGVYLNKCAIKMANLLALYKSHTRIQQIYSADQRFGMALADYQIFKDKVKRAKDQNDQFKIDLYMARLLFAKDRHENLKFRALRLTV